MRARLLRKPRRPMTTPATAIADKNQRRIDQERMHPRRHESTSTCLRLNPPKAAAPSIRRHMLATRRGLNTSCVHRCNSDSSLTRCHAPSGYSLISSKIHPDARTGKGRTRSIHLRRMEVIWPSRRRTSILKSLPTLRPVEPAAYPIEVQPLPPPLVFLEAFERALHDVRRVKLGGKEHGGLAIAMSVAAAMFGTDMGSQMHARGVEPAEEGLGCRATP